MNCILNKNDATAHPDAKISNALKRVVKTFDMSDSFRALHPKAKAFSRYYDDARCQGAIRIDRQYHWGNLIIKEAKYLPLAFSDHHSLIVSVILPDPLCRVICPKGRPAFRLKEEVIRDGVFQNSLIEAMSGWQRIKAFGLDAIQ